jgi:hypothetical protein
MTHDKDFLDRLGEMFELQGDLQRNTYGSHPADITDPEQRVQFIKDMHIALNDEMSEFLAEVGWKPWATSRHVNEEAAQGELVDAFHFFMNLCMAVKMTPDMLFEKYRAKRLKNIKRQEAGYDGIQGKCGECKRALDDNAVRCYEDPAHPGFFICYAGVDTKL